jgi:hypothetical protein
VNKRIIKRLLLKTKSYEVDVGFDIMRNELLLLVSLLEVSKYPLN